MSKTEAEEAPKPKFKYMCHGCTNSLGLFNTPAVNLRVICPSCKLDQLTVLENFIAV